MDTAINVITGILMMGLLAAAIGTPIVFMLEILDAIEELERRRK